MVTKIDRVASQFVSAFRADRKLGRVDIKDFAEAIWTALASDTGKEH